MPSKGAVAVALGLTAVAAAAGALLYLGSKKKSSRSSKSRRAARGGGASSSAAGGAKGFVDEKTLVLMFDEIIDKMKVVKVNLENWKLSVRRDVASKGAQVSDEEIDGMIQHHFAEQMKAVEQKIYKNHNVEKAEVELACEKYQSQPVYKKKVKQLQDLFDSISGPPPPPAGAVLVSKLPEGVTLDLVCQVVQKSMTAVHEYVYQGLVKEIQEAHPGMEKSDPVFQQAFYVEYQKRAPEKQQEVLEEHLGSFAADVLDEQGQPVTALQLFQAAIVKYQANPEFQRRMKAVQTEQTRLSAEQARAGGGVVAAQ